MKTQSLVHKSVLALLVLLLLPLLAGCWAPAESQVTAYTALDREFSEPIYDQFQQSSGVTVLPKYDVESTKTVGLVNEIIQEKDRPRCDVFWNNEILHTLRLERLGLLEPVNLPQADKFPAAYRSPDGYWYGFAARVRVLIVNTDLLAEGERPTSIRDLADPKWQGKCGIAKPLFGTTATHAAVLFALWGEDEAKEFFADVKQNAQVLSGNKQVALAVGRGELAFGITDTDDAIVEKEQGSPVEIIYPDQEEGGPGALFIPNTLCRIKGSRRPAEAQQLMSYLLTPEIEKQLAAGPSAQFPLHEDVTELPRVASGEIRRMDVDFAAAAEQWDTAAVFLRDTFATAE